MENIENLESELYLLDSFIFFLLVIFSAFFSGAETAFLSISKYSGDQLETGRARTTRRLKKLHSRTQDLLIAILIGNTLVNLSAATVAALMTHRLAQNVHLNSNVAILLEVIIVTLILLVLSEITPKFLAIKRPLKFASLVSGPILIYLRLMAPLTFLLNAMTSGLSHLLGISSRSLTLREEELRTLVEVGEEQGVLEKEEREMIHSIFEFRETQVKEVMIPRIDMVCIEKSATLMDLVNLIKQKGHTRIPLYEGRIDNILGIIHAKDLLPYLNQQNHEVELAQLARRALFVPEYKRIDELLKEFQKEKMHMAIVVDEYGGTAGLVTLEDILEEIVGEIQDEYDQETPLLRKIDENTYLVNAKIDLHDLNRELNLNLPTESDFESLGGFIFSLTGTVPKEKDVVAYKEHRFIIEKIDRNRIVQVRIEKVNDRAEPQTVEINP
ncbi:MAG: HlyC/CorC family transporter [Calditrichaeota bacterium]|nr:MAG: HlyC/CorC family transporter [Calditrichota bacterium]